MSLIADYLVDKSSPLVAKEVLVFSGIVPSDVRFAVKTDCGETIVFPDAVMLELMQMAYHNQKLVAKWEVWKREYEAERGWANEPH